VAAVVKLAKCWSSADAVDSCYNPLASRGAILSSRIS